jgi:hypothetical protein
MRQRTDTHEQARQWRIQQRSPRYPEYEQECGGKEKRCGIDECRCLRYEDEVGMEAGKQQRKACRKGGELQIPCEGPHGEHRKQGEECAAEHPWNVPM